MDNEKEIELRKALKAELLPPLLGLRNELKKVGETLTEIKNQQPPDLIKAEIINPTEPLKEVAISNFPETSKVEVLNPTKEVEVKGIGGFFDKVFEGFSALSDGITSLSLTIGKWCGEIKNQIFKVEVQNFPETHFPTKIDTKITNPEDFKQEFPTSMRISNSEPSEAIPVILATKDRKRFYQALEAVVAIGDDINLHAVTKKLDTIITTLENLDITINAGDIQIGAVEIKDGDSDTRMDVEADPVATTKNSAFVQAPSLLAELQAIKGFVDGLEGFTDGIEGALATLNAKDFATETTLLATKTELIAIKGFVDDIETKLQTLIQDNIDTISNAGTASSKVVNVQGQTGGIPIPISGTISQAAISPAHSLYRQALFAPLVVSTWRNFIRFIVPTGKKMLIHNFSSLSSAAGTRSRLAVREDLATYNFGTNTFVKLFNAETDRFFSNIDVIVTTALVNTATFNINITYTNQNGITGRVGTISIASPLGVDKRRAVMIFQGDDYGVLEITNITETNATVTGQVTIQGFEVLMEEVEQIANKKHIRFFASNQSQGIVIDSGKKVDIDIFSTSLTNYTRNVDITYSLI